MTMLIYFLLFAGWYVYHYLYFIDGNQLVYDLSFNLQKS